MQSQVSRSGAVLTVQAPPENLRGWGTTIAADAPLERVDVAVIGGGLAGLAAAATAARAGRSVVLYEGASALGGRAQTRSEQGFSFNVGAHAIYLKGAGIRVLRDLGVEPRGGIPDQVGTLALWDRRLDRFPADVRSFFGTSLLDGAAKLDLALFLAKLPLMKPESLADLTAREWLDGALRTDAARKIVEVVVRTATYSDVPDRLSAAAALRRLKAGLGGVLYVDGGWQTFVDDLRQRAQTLGARVAAGASVATVERQASGWTVRLAGGARQEASAVVLAVGPEDARDLVAHGNAALERWAAQAEPVRVASYDLGLRRLPRPETRLVFGVDRPLFLSVHSAWAKLAPDGGALIHVTRYLGDSPRGDADDAQEIEALLDRVQPGWRDEVVVRRFVPSLIVSHALPSVAWETTVGPRDAAVPDADGLFVAGDWVGPTEMIGDRALESGSRAGAGAAELAGRLAAPRAAGLMEACAAEAQ